MTALLFNYFREQERYLLRIQELETAVARLGEESIDKATLLESVQSDKETISRSGGSLTQLKIAILRFFIRVVCFQTMFNYSSLSVKANLNSHVHQPLGFIYLM